MNFLAAFLTILASGIPLIAGQVLDESFGARLDALNTVACRQNSGGATSYSRLLKLFDNVPRCVSERATDADDECPVEAVKFCNQQTIEVAASCLPGNRTSNELILSNSLRQFIPFQCNAGKDSTNAECDDVNAGEAIVQCNVPILRLDSAISNLNARQCRALMDNKQCMMVLLKPCPYFVQLGAFVYDVIYTENECAKYAGKSDAENENESILTN